MSQYERSTESTATPDQVWELWSNTNTWPRWNPDVRDISLDGSFQSGTTGSMTSRAGTHSIRLENVFAGRSFDLVTSPIPATTFRFHCEVTPHGVGSRLSQSVSMSGLMAPLMSRMMGKRVAAGFQPLLDGLAKEAESRVTVS
ncbi:MAG TPA: SRPBCC family protein [Chloroflexota bacterium]